MRRIGTIGCVRCGLGCQRSLTLRNRQRRRRVNAPLLRRIVEALLEEVWPDGDLDLGVYLVAGAEITRLNETYLRHRGSTDVITFDYAERHKGYPASLQGEIFVCVEEAVAQAARFRANWQSELVRYVVHGVLHLLDYDDLRSGPRRRMKAAEDALVDRLAARFNFRRLSRPHA